MTTCRVDYPEAADVIDLSFRDGVYTLPIRVHLPLDRNCSDFSEDEVVDAVLDTRSVGFVLADVTTGTEENQVPGSSAGSAVYIVDEPSVDEITMVDVVAKPLWYSTRKAAKSCERSGVFMAAGVQYKVNPQFDFTTSPFLFSQWNSTRAVYGLAGSRCPFAPGCTGTLSERIFVLELNPASPKLYSKGMKPGTCHEAYHWSETQSPSFRMYEFPLYHLSACGNDLAQNYSSSMRARLDPMNRCLGLPSEIFHNLMAWVPSVCDPEKDYCTVPSGVQVDALPSIEFALQDGPRESLDLRVPLSMLVHGEEQAYCVVKQGSYQENCVNSTCITLGSAVLESMSVAVDLDRRRVGLLNLANIPGSRGAVETCTPNATCRGDQWLYIPSNTCTNPHCDTLFFYSLNTATMRCELHRALNFAIFATIICCLAVDFFNRRVLRKIKAGIVKPRG